MTQALLRWHEVPRRQTYISYCDIRSAQFKAACAWSQWIASDGTQHSLPLSSVRFFALCGVL